MRASVLVCVILGIVLAVGAIPPEDMPETVTDAGDYLASYEVQPTPAAQEPEPLRVVFTRNYLIAIAVFGVIFLACIVIYVRDKLKNLT